jgi:hypothetical protein
VPEEGLEPPNTRIMIGALALIFAAIEAGFGGFGGVRSCQICRVGDMVGDTMRQNRAELHPPRETVRELQRELS